MPILADALLCHLRFLLLLHPTKAFEVSSKGLLECSFRLQYTILTKAKDETEKITNILLYVNLSIFTQESSKKSGQVLAKSFVRVFLMDSKMNL